MHECKKWFDRYIATAVLMKTTDDSKLHIKKSNHNLNFANWIIEKHKNEIPKIFGEETFYDWAISIYYYAIYHSSLALISREGYESKNHSATLCFLIYHHYHKQNTLKKEDIEFIAEYLNKKDIETIGFSKELRDKASYDVHESFELNLCEQIRDEAINLINKIKILLQK